MSNLRRKCLRKNCVNPEIMSKKIEQKKYKSATWPNLETRSTTRDGVGEGMVLAGQLDKRVVVLSADLTESTRAHLFREAFPERFFEVGVAEQNLLGMAAGLALSDKIPFACSYAVFSPGRSWDQLRVSICYGRANVKIIGGHTGLGIGEDGATHQALEDLAITRCLPNLVVLSPCDAEEAKRAVLAAAKWPGPVYIRTTKFAGRNVSILANEHDNELGSQAKVKRAFRIGPAQLLQEGSDVTLVATGHLVGEVIVAAGALAAAGVSVEVIAVPTIKPLDVRTLAASAKKTRAVVTIEDHQVIGGLGSAVAEALAQLQPTPMHMIGMRDAFGESGKGEELLEKYGLMAPSIVASTQKFLSQLNRNR
jgi:transketolase